MGRADRAGFEVRPNGGTHLLGSPGSTDGSAAGVRVQMTGHVQATIRMQLTTIQAVPYPLEFPHSAEDADELLDFPVGYRATGPQR